MYGFSMSDFLFTIDVSLSHSVLKLITLPKRDFVLLILSATTQPGWPLLL